jgi:hypothetical protein
MKKRKRNGNEALRKMSIKKHRATRGVFLWTDLHRFFKAKVGEDEKAKGERKMIDDTPLCYPQITQITQIFWIF